MGGNRRDIAGKIQDNMLSFENLGDSDNRSIQTLMQRGTRYAYDCSKRCHRASQR